MPTQSEQKALAFVAIVVLLAGAVRVVKAGGPAAEVTPQQQQGLARQAFAANSAAVAQKTAREARGKGQPSGSRGSSARKSYPPRLVAPKGRDTVPNVVGGVASVPWNDRRGFPPPVPRVDSDSPAADTLLAGSGRRGKRRGSNSAKAPPSRLTGPVDLDTASQALIETLPRVGPALARRIVANRDSLGPFRSIDGLRRVKGIGPATVALLGPLVTFSRQARP
jgi:helix-hairpin-helix protein